MNVLAGFYLIDQLLDKLDDQARIVNVSSVMSKFINNYDGDIDFKEYFKTSNKGYFDWMQYTRSKLGVVLYTAGLQQVLDKKGIKTKAVSLHPGAISSELMSTMHPAIYFCYRAFFPLAWCFMKNCAEGSQTTLFCSYMPYEDLVGCEYYSDCRLAGKSLGATQRNINMFMNKCKATIEPLIQGKQIKHLIL